MLLLALEHWRAHNYPCTEDQNKRQQIGATQAKLICFHLCKNEPRWNVECGMWNVSPQRARLRLAYILISLAVDCFVLEAVGGILW